MGVLQTIARASLVGLVALAPWLPLAAHATPDADAYATTVRLVDNLFLEQEDVLPVPLLQAAADGAASEVHWLFVDDTEAGVSLRHGDGRPLGTVEVTDLAALPEALQALEARVLRAGPQLDVGPVRLAILDGLTDGLDRFSRVLSGDGLARFDTRLKGTLVGIGAGLRWVDETLTITSITPGGPAAKGGLRVGDELLRIDDRSTVNLPVSEAVRMVQGREGTPVSLTVRRESRELVLPLVRAEVILPNVTHRDLGDGIGYVHIEHVSQRTVVNLRAALASLRKEGSLTHGLVIDLRDNTGGSMKEAARAADEFLTEGLLLRTVGHDGQRVQNLQAEMRASDDGQEVQLPVMLVVNDRTASGSEILAGALLEHERTALVGSRTYGKGTVQKIYTLDDDTRLKLTVARYLLANDRRIEASGLLPDVMVASIALDADGAHLHGFDGAVPREELVVAVDEHEGWRGEASSPDLPLALATETLKATAGLDRASLLAALQQVAATTRAEQESALADALAARGIDWSPASGDQLATWPDAEVTLQASAPEHDVITITATVTNNDAEPLHRALVELSCWGLSAFDDVAIPVGKLAPGATTTVSTRVFLPPGTGPRDDEVTAVLHSHRRPKLQAGSTVVHSVARRVPEVTVDARLVPHGPVDEAGQPVLRAELTVHHPGPGAMAGVEVHFDYPDDPSIELLDRGARVPNIPAKTSRRFDLTLQRAAGGPDTLDLDLVIDTERFGRLERWPLKLPVDGTSVHYEAPTVTLPSAPSSAPTGPLRLPISVRDDGTIDHVRIYVDGRKTAWYAGNDRRLDLDPVITLRAGTRRILVVAEDDQGLVTWQRVYVRGEEPSLVDAAP